MADSFIDGLNEIDRDRLMAQMASELDLICGEMGERLDGIALRTGMERERLSLIASGKRKMKWSEYLSILFVLWENDKGRELIEKRGYFPEELKNAMTTNRNAHGMQNEGI